MMTKPWFGPGPQNVFWNVKILDFWVWDVISYLTSHFGQYKRNIKRGQANIDLQAIGSDTLNSRIRIFEIFKKFFDSGSTSLRKMVVR
jgi:hypothetical protein